MYPTEINSLINLLFKDDELKIAHLRIKRIFRANQNNFDISQIMFLIESKLRSYLGNSLQHCMPFNLNATSSHLSKIEELYQVVLNGLKEKVIFTNETIIKLIKSQPFYEIELDHCVKVCIDEKSNDNSHDTLNMDLLNISNIIAILNEIDEYFHTKDLIGELVCSCIQNSNCIATKLQIQHITLKDINDYMRPYIK